MLGGSEPKYNKQEIFTKKSCFGFENDIRGVQKYIKSNK